LLALMLLAAIAVGRGLRREVGALATA
jgi:hypothetical protein